MSYENFINLVQYLPSFYDFNEENLKEIYLFLRNKNLSSDEICLNFPKFKQYDSLFDVHDIYDGYSKDSIHIVSTKDGCLVYEEI